MSPFLAIPRSPGSWARALSSAAATSRSSAGDPNAADIKVQDVSPAETLTPAARRAPANAVQAVDGLAKQSQGNDQITTYDEFHQRAAAMILSSEARGAFAIEQEADRLRERYGRNTFGQSCLLAAG